MRLLISCCDNGTGLFLWDGSEFTHLVHAHSQSVLRTPLGIALMSEGLISIYDEEKLKAGKLKVVNQIKFPLPGHHGSCWDSKTGCIVTASSDYNKLIWTSPWTGERKGEMEVNRPGSHTNDIDVHDKYIYVSSFVRGITRINRETGEREDLYQCEAKAHSIKMRHGDLWWCESEKSRVKKNGEVVAEHPGFVRGLEWFGGELVVGVSHHKYRNEGHAGFYFQDKFHAVPNGVTNVYSLLVLQ